MLEGEIIPPSGSGHQQGTKSGARVRVIKLGLFGKLLAGLAAVALLMVLLVLAASAFILLLPIVAITALYGWWKLRRIRK